MYYILAFENQMHNSIKLKMNVLTFFVLSLIGCSSAYLIKVPTANTIDQPRIAPLGWVHIQKLLLPLFENVCEESTNTAVVQIAKDFSLDSTNGDYMKTDVIENLRSLRTSKGFLPKGQIFSEYNVDHAKELKALYEVFFCARDFNTFYKAAAWARQNANCGLFVDAIYLAIVNRKDLAKVSVPALYELLPNYFINKNVVVRASLLLTADNISPITEPDVRVEGNSYILDANYTAEVEGGDEDSKLAYFREDIGLNTYYFIRKLRNSPWFNTPNVANNLYGERMFMMMRQFAARYDLERYSHGLPELEGFDLDSTVAYDPMLIYSNGNEFKYRTFPDAISSKDDVGFLKTLENNIAGVVAHLRQAGHSKSQILSHLVEILVTSDKSYETMCRKLLGNNENTTDRDYSVLEHYMTTLRDPMFWRINKKIVQLVNNALKNLPSYSRNELFFPGVEVLNIETKKMMTTLDNFQFDVTDSLKSSSSNATFQVKISQPRLNHKPFTMKLNISSLVYKKGIVKIFIGPKIMPGELAIKKHLFVLLDSFEVNLKKGYNVVSRSSDEMSSFSTDFLSLRALRKKVEDADFGLDALPLKSVESQIGYPNRLILPKGLSGGLPLQVLVFVAPLTKGTVGGGNMEINTAVLSPGYPFDLPIEIRQLLGLPNFLVREFIVTHKSEGAKPGNGGRPGNAGKPGGGGRPGANNYNYDQGSDNFQTDITENGDEMNDNSQDNTTVDDFFDDSLLVHGLLGERPDFTYRNTDNTSFGGNKNHYRKKEDYSSKRKDKSYYGSKSDYRSSTSNDFKSLIPVTESEDFNTLPVHGLLGDRPIFTYKNKDASDQRNKYQQKKKEDFVTRSKDKVDETVKEQNEKYIFNTIPMTVIGDGILYDDLLIKHSLLDSMPDIHENVEENKAQLKEKKYQFIKKEQERAAKREQKKEKYINIGEQKQEESIVKKDKKFYDNLAKKEKRFKDLIKKGVYKNLTSDLVDEVSEIKMDKSVKDFNNQITNDLSSDEESDKTTYPEFSTQESILHTDTMPQNLLVKSTTMHKSDILDNNTKTYQIKKKTEESRPLKVEYIKKKEIIINKNDDIREEHNKKEINEKPVTDSVMDENIYNLIQKNRKKYQDKSQNISPADVFDRRSLEKNIEYITPNETNFAEQNQNIYTNKEVTKNIDKNIYYNKLKDNKSTITKDVSKVIANDQVYNTISDDTLNKNVIVDKHTDMQKAIRKDIPVVRTEKTDDSKFDEKDEVFNYIMIYEPIITTEKPKKRVSVYDFLFNPPVYDDDELIYE